MSIRRLLLLVIVVLALVPSVPSAAHDADDAALRRAKIAELVRDVAAGANGDYLTLEPQGCDDIIEVVRVHLGPVSRSPATRRKAGRWNVLGHPSHVVGRDRPCFPEQARSNCKSF